MLRRETTSKWSRTMRCWYVPEGDFNLGRFFSAMKSVGYIDYSALKNKPTAALNGKDSSVLKINRNKNIALPKGYLERLQQERYSENTIIIYTHVSEHNFKNFKNPLDELL